MLLILGERIIYDNFFLLVFWIIFKFPAKTEENLPRRSMLPTNFGYFLRLWYKWQMQQFMVVSLRMVLLPGSLCLGGCRLRVRQGWEGRQVLWVCGYVAWILDWFVLACTIAVTLDMCIINQWENNYTQRYTT